ncbi:MAG: hypothetical protein GWN02_17690 [Gemmatimonadetes bacterium]|nr:hypothetical protein [Gemmatimonadota bacterium]
MWRCAARRGGGAAGWRGGRRRWTLGLPGTLRPPHAPRGYPAIDYRLSIIDYRFSLDPGGVTEV